MNLKNELAERKRRNKAMRNFVKTKFPKAIYAYRKEHGNTQSQKVGRVLRIVKYSDMGDKWDIKSVLPATWENTNREFVRLFEILNYGDSIEDLQRLIKSLKSIIKQGKKNGMASIDMTDISIWCGSVDIHEPKWWFDVLEKTFFEE